ncbi:MAG: hypothetical protein KH896_00770 [Clostridiales bacterium]|nr:hypothetical protein [Clostridiales bacterium]
MVKRGSITVFLALILSLVTALVCTGIESVRMAAARTQILNGADIGLYSLFGQFDREMLKDYDLFLLDGSCGQGSLDLASVYDNFSSYMKPVLKQNSQKLSVVQGGFSAYRLLTDEGGEPFYNQVVQYMKETLGSQGVSLLLDKMKDRKEKTEQAEQAGEQAENGDIIENYDAEMEENNRKNEEALAEAEKNPEGGELEDGDNVTAPPQKVVNPISIIRRIRKMGILELVIPGNKGVYDGQVQAGTLLSRREKQKGMPMYEPEKTDTSYTSQILFQQYLMEKLGNYSAPGKGALKYQTEYILGGKTGDIENLKSVAGRLLLIREGVNIVHLVSDGTKRAQAAGLASAIASAFLIPPATGVIEAAILLCWAFGESILDVRELFDGGKVPLVKSTADWQLSLENLPELLNGLDSVRRGSEDGMSYEDYLQVLLLGVSREEKITRAMDMIELCVREKGRKNFRMDSCIVAAEISVDVKANKRKVFNVTRAYGYY